MKFKIWYKMKVHKQHNINGNIDIIVKGQFVEDCYASIGDKVYYSYIDNYKKFGQFITAVRHLKKIMDDAYNLRRLIK